MTLKQKPPECAQREALLADCRGAACRRRAMRGGVCGALVFVGSTVVLGAVADPQNVARGIANLPGILFTWMFILGDNATSSEHLAHVAQPYIVLLNSMLGFIAGALWSVAISLWRRWRVLASSRNTPV